MLPSPANRDGAGIAADPASKKELRKNFLLESMLPVLSKAKVNFAISQLFHFLRIIVFKIRIIPS